MQINLYHKSKTEAIWLAVEAMLQCGFDVSRLNKEKGLVIGVKKAGGNNLLIVNVLISGHTDCARLSFASNIFSGTETFLAITTEVKRIVSCIQELALADKPDEIMDSQESLVLEKPFANA